MVVETLDDLGSAFQEWRQKKRYARQATPKELLDRARRAIEVHGVQAVCRVTRLDRARLSEPIKIQNKSGKKTPPAATPAIPSAPAFSRIDFPPPNIGAGPLIEVETPAGMKIKVFSSTPETFGLLSKLCGIGGAR